MIRFVFFLFFISHSVIFSQITQVTGDVYLNGKAVRPGMSVTIGDTIRTSSESSVSIVLYDRTIIYVKENSLVTFDNLIPKKRKVHLSLLNGMIQSIVKKESEFSIQTPSGTASIRGTIFFVQAKKDESYFCTCNGSVSYISQTSEQRTITAKHHAGVRIKKGIYFEEAGMENHTDEEIINLFSYVLQ